MSSSNMNSKEKINKDTIGSKYDMNENEYQRCLSLAEVSTFLEAHTEQRPKSIYVVAQPGAGKTGLRKYLIREQQNKGEFMHYIEFNPDEIATHHMNYTDILRDYPENSYDILQRFTRRALDTYLRQRAVEISCNIMQEGTFRNTDGYIDIVRFQKNGGKAEIGQLDENGQRQSKIVKGGYDVEINILAVNQFESLISSFEREQYFIKNGLPPRAVTIENHDISYEKMLDTIDIIEKEKLYDSMCVYRRGYIEEKPDLIFKAGDKKYVSTSDMIRRERRRQEQELFENPNEYLGRIADLKSEVTNKSLIGRISELESKFNRERDIYLNQNTID